MPFWLNLVYNGARVGGRLETNHLSLELQSLGVSAECPDSLAGSASEKRAETEARSVYFRRPPDKRTNYVKHRIAYNPFTTPWSELVKEFCGKSENFHVLRDSKRLFEWNRCLKEMIDDMKISEEEHSCLIPVALEVIGKGKVGARYV